MLMTEEQFRRWPDKAITLLGMSGVGKTRISSLLHAADWFHYSGDYRIGTHYLAEPMLDNLKRHAMQIPLLAQLLRSDSVHLQNNLSVHNLEMLSSFLGMLGNPELGGIPLAEFKRRQAMFRAAEIAAMRDVPEFIARARDIYGYRSFVNDAGGSLCELDDPTVTDALQRHTVIVYIKATKADEEALIARAEARPKPMFYRETFLDEHLARYMREQSLEFVADIEPTAFVRWIFPVLFHSRVPRYEAIAQEIGYTISTRELAEVASADDFVEAVATAIGQHTATRPTAAEQE